jgi:hypothetical protein
MIALEWSETTNIGLPVFEVRRNGVKLASICFAGGEKPWEIQMHLPGAFIRLSERYHARRESAQRRVEREIEDWVRRMGLTAL